MNKFDRGRVVVAVISIIALIAVVIVLGARSGPPPPINGDQLGMESGEDFHAYTARANASLDALDDDAHHFALVTFTEPLTPARAGDLTEPVGRVNAIIVANAQPWSVPEPIDGESRSDVYTRELERIADGLSGIGNLPVPETLNGVVIWDDPATLRALDDDPLVATVEALPADAQWGRFGVSPVTPPV